MVAVAAGGAAAAAAFFERDLAFGAAAVGGLFVHLDCRIERHRSGALGGSTSSALEVSAGFWVDWLMMRIASPLACKVSMKLNCGG